MELVHEITNRLSCRQHSQVHTPCGDNRQSPSAISSHSAPFRSSYQSEEVKAVKVHKSLVIILDGQVCREHPILQSYSLYLMEQKVFSINKYSFRFFSSSRTFFDLLGCMLKVWSRLRSERKFQNLEVKKSALL